VIDRFKQGFLEEARELLSELESALLELDQKRDDPEIVGRAFRALHTIKGSGAMFGFDDIAGFAHQLEAGFDRLRKRELVATTDLINLSLAASDQIKTMLDAAAGLGTTDQDRSARILAELRGLTGAPEPHQNAAPVLRAEALAAEPGLLADWAVRFRPGPDVLVNGTNPLLLLREMRELGQLQIQLDTTAIPPLSEIDPERCYVCWDMVLRTAAGREAIRDIFIFIEDDCELKIEPAAGGAGAPVPVARPARRESPNICAAQGPRRLRQPARSSARSHLR